MRLLAKPVIKDLAVYRLPASVVIDIVFYLILLFPFVVDFRLDWREQLFHQGIKRQLSYWERRVSVIKSKTL